MKKIEFFKNYIDVLGLEFGVLIHIGSILEYAKRETKNKTVIYSIDMAILATKKECERMLDEKVTMSDNKKYVKMSNNFLEAVALYNHLKNHNEVINANVNKGEPMCKICNKTAREILKEQ